MNESLNNQALRAAVARMEKEGTRESREVDGAEQVEQKTPLQLFEELYLLQNNQEMTREQKEVSLKLMETIWEDEE